MNSFLNSLLRGEAPGTTDPGIAEFRLGIHPPQPAELLTLIAAYSPMGSMYLCTTTRAASHVLRDYSPTTTYDEYPISGRSSRRRTRERSGSGPLDRR